MNTFKKKILHEAVLSTFVPVAPTGEAQAVVLSLNVVPEAFIYPYYRVNTEGKTKVAKVRFLEGKNSREVLDFNLFLSPADVWALPDIDMKQPVGLERTREGYFEVIQPSMVLMKMEDHEIDQYAEAVMRTRAVDFMPSVIIPTTPPPDTSLTDWQLIFNNRTLFLPFKKEGEED